MGGVGKTTIVTNTAAVLGRRGYDVLAIDLDPQPGSMTAHLGYEALKTETDPSHDHVGEILIDSEPRLDEIIVDTGDFDLVPAHEGLSAFDQELISQQIPMQDQLLLHEMRALADEYDYFLVDPPATLGKLVDNAIYACRNMLIPMELTKKGRDSADGIIRTIESMENEYQRGDEDFQVSILSIVPNMVGDSTIYRESRAALEAAGYPILPAGIRKRDILKDAWDAGQHVFAYMDDPAVDVRDYERDHLESVFGLVADVVDVTAETPSLTPEEVDHGQA